MREQQPSARALRDAVMMQVLLALWIANRTVYGAHKLWKAARRAGHDIGRDQVARLMRELSIEGISRRRKKVFTTIADPDALRAPDLVKRNFTAAAPNQLRVTDLTYVPTRSCMAYVCFMVDAFSRRIVGWRVAANMKTDMILDAWEMARASARDASSVSSPTATAAVWVARLGEAHAQGRLHAELTRLGRYPLLIIDEVGYIPFDGEAANLFFQLVSARYERASVIVTSNKPFGWWGKVLEDATVAAAMLDRLVHHAEVINLKGDSYRLKNCDLGRVPTDDAA